MLVIWFIHRISILQKAFCAKSLKVSHSFSFRVFFWSQNLSATPLIITLMDSNNNTIHGNHLESLTRDDTILLDPDTPPTFGTPNGTVITAQVGATAFLPCTVHSKIEWKMVSFHRNNFINSLKRYSKRNSPVELRPGKLLQWFCNWIYFGFWRKFSGVSLCWDFLCTKTATICILLEFSKALILLAKIYTCFALVGYFGLTC